VKHTLLAQYYPRVQTLREYVLDKLPLTSRLRRRKIAAVGTETPKGSPETATSGVGLLLRQLLDSTLVGIHPSDETQPGDAWEKWLALSQKGDESYVTISNGVSGAKYSQAELSTLDVNIC